MEHPHKVVESLLRELMSILEEDVAFVVEDDAEEGVYVNFEGSLYALPEDRAPWVALEHLIRGAVRRMIGKELEIVIDVNGAVKRRRAELIRSALGKAEEARREHKRVRLNPMPSHERRSVHVALANFPGIRTYSTGEGDARQVMIEPDETA